MHRSIIAKIVKEKYSFPIGERDLFSAKETYIIYIQFEFFYNVRDKVKILSYYKSYYHTIYINYININNKQRFLNIL